MQICHGLDVIKPLLQDQPLRQEEPHQADGCEEISIGHVLCAEGGAAAARTLLCHGHL